jgi:hypothetical protein
MGNIIYNFFFKEENLNEEALRNYHTTRMFNEKKRKEELQQRLKNEENIYRMKKRRIDFDLSTIEDFQNKNGIKMVKLKSINENGF